MLLATLIFLAAKAQDLIGRGFHASEFKKSLNQGTANNSELLNEDIPRPIVYPGPQKEQVDRKYTSSWPLASEKKDTTVPNLLNSRTLDIGDPSKTLDVENVAYPEWMETTAVKSTSAPLTLVNANGEYSLKLGEREKITSDNFLKARSTMLSEASTYASSARPMESPKAGSSRSSITAAPAPAHIAQTEMDVTDETVDPSASIPSNKSVPADGEVINAQAADLERFSVSLEKNTTISIPTKSAKFFEAPAKSTKPEKKTTASITIETESKSTDVPAPITKIVEKSISVEELNQKPDLKQTEGPSPVKELNTPPKPISSDHEQTSVTNEQPSKSGDSQLNISPTVEPKLKTKETPVIENQIATVVTQIAITNNSMWELQTVRPSSTSSKKTKEKPNIVVPLAAPIMREPLPLETASSIPETIPEKSSEKPSGSAKLPIEFNESLEDKNIERSSNSYNMLSVILLVFLTCSIILAAIYFWRWIEPIWLRRWSGYSRVRGSDSISDLEMDAFDHEVPSYFTSDRDRFLNHRGVAPRCPTKGD